jgi:3-oxoacyl-(acyl-carrier-protein) synthase
VLVLEELGHALKRGARIYAELAGYGLSSDAYHYTRPAPDGAGPARAMQLAIADANMEPHDIDYVNAHGTSTVPNDRIETIALKRAFGKLVGQLAVSSSKSMLGHMLGAAGAVEAAITCLVLQNGIIPPTINLSTRTDCDWTRCERRPKEEGQRRSFNSLGFGGINAPSC